jgi:hypothetical protein
MVFKLLQMAVTPIQLLLLGRPRFTAITGKRHSVMGFAFQGSWWLFLMVVAVLLAALFILRIVLEVVFAALLRATR